MNKPQSFTVHRAEHSTSFVAVETRPSKKPVEVFVYDQPVTLPVHPEVLVTAYPTAKVKDVKDSGNGNVQVVIDAATIPTAKGVVLKHDMFLNAVDGSIVVQYARHALEKDLPVFFAYEQRRKAKSGDTGEYIPYTASILTLAGWTDERKKQTMEAARENLSKVLAAIGPAENRNETYISDEARCDPRTWEDFATNYEGKITPAGWVRPTDADGNPTGCLIREDDAPEKPLSPIIEKELAEIRSRLDDIAAAPTYTSARGEAKPWMVHNHRGEINPGSYAVTAATAASRRARRIIRDALAEMKDVTTEQRKSAADKLTGVLLWLTDKVQQDVTGYTDRTAASYRIAADHVADVIDFDLPYLAEFTDGEDGAVAGKEWAGQVRTEAGAGFAAAVQATVQWAEPKVADQPAEADNEESNGDASDGGDAAESTDGATPAQEDATGADQGQQEGSESAPESTEVDNSPADAEDRSAAVQMVADVPELCDRWDQLIGTINMASHITHLNPILTAKFGTCMTGEIPAKAFSPMLDQWEADPARFTDAAKRAYLDANQAA